MLSTGLKHFPRQPVDFQDFHWQTSHQQSFPVPNIPNYSSHASSTNAP